MDEITAAKAHLEKVYTEYIQYKEYIKDKIKQPDQIRKEIAEEIKTELNIDRIQDLVYQKSEKNLIYQADFKNLMTRLYHTIEAYKDILEIPEEIKEEVKLYKFVQLLSIKNNMEKVVDQAAIDQIKDAIKSNVEQIKKYYVSNE